VTLVNLYTFTPNLTPTQTWDIVNSLSVSFDDFAHKSHYNGRMYGVFTGDMRFDNKEDNSYDDTVINECLREAIWRTLYSVQEETERHVGFNFSPRYHTNTDKFLFGEPQQDGIWPGIEEADVVQAWSTLAGLDAVTVNPFVVTGTTAANVGGVWVVTVDASIVDNPHNVLIRRDDNGHVYPLLHSATYPRRNAGNWEIAIDVDVIGYTALDLLNIQHVYYTFVDITTPVCAGETHPVYQNTNQIIPQAKAPEDIGGGQTRYWLYIYTLVDPAFYNAPTDLLGAPGEYYKLLEEIEFRCVTETESKAIITRECKCDYECDCDNATYRAATTIIDAKQGIVSFCIDAKLDDDGITWVATSSCCPITDDGTGYWKVTHTYKTAPEYLPKHAFSSVSNLLYAMLHKVAADLPTKDCGCEVKHGFIYENQQAYGSLKFNPITNETTQSFKYGDLHGQRIYAETLTGVAIMKYTLL
jgi:hypothetical protein